MENSGEIDTGNKGQEPVSNLDANEAKESGFKDWYKLRGFTKVEESDANKDRYLVFYILEKQCIEKNCLKCNGKKVIGSPGDDMQELRIVECPIYESEKELRKSNFPAKYRNLTLKSFDSELWLKKIASEYISQFPENVKVISHIPFTGDYEKTTGALRVILKELLNSCKIPAKGIFVKATDLNHYLDAKNPDAENYLKKFRYYSLLIIDKLGMTAFSKHVQNQVTRILETREERELPTLITIPIYSNCEKELEINLGKNIFRFLLYKSISLTDGKKLLDDGGSKLISPS